MKKTLILLFIILPVICLTAQDMTAEEVINRMDINRTFDTSKVEGAMIITDRFGERESTFVAYSRGKYDSLIEFTSVAERGQKILRTRRALYLYFPDAEEVTSLRGSALKQSLLGSDISYEDMTSDKGTLESYDVEMVGSEEVLGKDCYIIEMVAKIRSVAYYRQKIWVDKETFLTLKAEYFSKSGKQVKEMLVKEVDKVDTFWYPSVSELKDTLKKNSKTELRFDAIELDVPLAEDLFTRESLL